MAPAATAGQEVAPGTEGAPGGEQTEANPVQDQPGTDVTLKLYRRAPGQTNYWETWEEENAVVVHQGVLGDTGETIRLPKNPSTQHQVRSVSEQRRSEGYTEVPDEDHATVILQYSID